MKQGDGYDGKHPFIGEKWDQFALSDVDHDGDKKIVANCEEYHLPGKNGRVFLAVAWFENPGRR